MTAYSIIPALPGATTSPGQTKKIPAFTKTFEIQSGWLTGDDSHVIFFRVYRNLGGESQTGRDAYRERGQLKTRGRFTGKWFAEGKGKRGNPEYPDRGLALRAECVLARS